MVGQDGILGTCEPLPTLHGCMVAWAVACMSKRHKPTMPQEAGGAARVPGHMCAGPLGTRDPLHGHVTVVTAALPATTRADA